MILANLKYESALWEGGYRFIGGADEVGRGSFAGPVTAGICVFEEGIAVPEGVKIHDSKSLNSKQREAASAWIKNTASFWAVGEASAPEIDRLGIVRATQRAFRRARAKISRIDFLLADAFYLPRVPGIPVVRQKAIIKGDQLSFAIAASSIIAKVERDRKMVSLAEKYTVYGWEKNKGYGTLFHRKAIKKHGLTRHHRKSYSSSSLCSL